MKFCQEAWNEEEKVKYFRNCFAKHIFNLSGRIIWTFLFAEQNNLRRNVLARVRRKSSLNDCELWGFR